DDSSNRQTNANLLLLANAYRRHGHLSADLDPLGLRKVEYVPSAARGGARIVALAPDLPSTASLQEIVAALRRIYCQTISYEFEHIESPTVRRWFSNYVESLDMPDLPERSAAFHELLVKVELFEQFLQKKMPSTKRYGLEGSENMA
ncbi:hypothetical protein IWQ56_007381, partial [Coemansia nantahalensis]